MKYTAKIGAQEFVLDIADGRVTVDGSEVDVSFVQVGTSAYSMLVDGQSIRVMVEIEDDTRMRVTTNGVATDVRIWNEHDLLLERLGGTSEHTQGTQHVLAPMPGLVRAVRVSEGETVTVGSGLVVLEAMKMENELHAEVAGTVRAVRVAPGDAVEKNQLLLEIGPEST